MKLRDRIAMAMAAFSGQDPAKASGIDPRTQNALAIAGVDLDAEVECEEVDLVPFGDEAKLREELAEERRQRAAREGEAWADSIIAAGKAFPAERAALVAQFARAAEDDANSAATVTFAIGKTAFEGSRVDALKAIYEARPSHGLTAEQLRAIESGDAKVLMGERSGSGMSEERRKQLLALTPLGQACLKE